VAGGNALPAIIFMLDEKSCLHMKMAFIRGHQQGNNL
jgi:hypothetical protein